MPNAAVRIGTSCLLLLVVILEACGGKGAPKLTSVTPATGTITTIVNIAGSDFVQTASGGGASDVDPTVTFKARGSGASTKATVRTFSTTSLEVAVPEVAGADAATGTVFDVIVENPSGGSTTLEKAFTMAAPATTDVNGGIVGSGTVNSLFIIDGNNFGDLPATPPANFSVDFRDSASSNVVASATVALANQDWQNIFIVGVVPGALSPSVTYKLTVTTPSGTSTPKDFKVLSAVSFSPSAIAWSATSALPTAKQGFPAVVTLTSTSAFIYALGGNDASAVTSNGKASNLTEVVYNSLDGTTGALAGAGWTTTAPLPDKRGFAAAISADAFNSIVPGEGMIYVFGGLDGAGNATSTVYSATLNADGSVPASGAGTWATTTALPEPLFGSSAVIFHGRIYVAGGNTANGSPTNKVYSSLILSDGTLAPWQSLPDLPASVAYHQLVTSAGYLYVLGGDSGAEDPISKTAGAASQSAVYYAQINIRTGGFVSTSWTNTSAMGKSREKFSATVAGSYVLLSGGLYNGDATGSSEQSYAALNTDGSVASFNGATGAHTISGTASGYNFFNHASAYFVDNSGNPHVLILGGQDLNTGLPVAGVWYQH
jgi:hypothetical protein